MEIMQFHMGKFPDGKSSFMMGGSLLKIDQSQWKNQ